MRGASGRMPSWQMGHCGCLDLDFFGALFRCLNDVEGELIAEARKGERLTAAVSSALPISAAAGGLPSCESLPLSVSPEDRASLASRGDGFLSSSTKPISAWSRFRLVRVGEAVLLLL